MNTIKHFACGGTIDSHWDGAKDTAVPNVASVVFPYLTKTVRFEEIDSETLLLKDSREITTRDQDRIAARVAETTHKNVLLTIGTYLMPDVARVIAQHPMAEQFDDLNKRVTLTGSTVPMQGYLNSDGGFNLGMSIAALQEPSIERISIVMNGCVMRARDIRKDLSTATFSGIEGRDQLPFDQFDLLTVGGSIDFEPNGFDEFAAPTTSRIPNFLRDTVRLQLRAFHAVNPFVKGSPDLTEEDIDQICRLVKRSRAQRVLVTMGLYKMEAMKKRLEAEISTDRCVVLTGSRLPLAATDMTDAPFNLGYSLGKIGFLPNGVHIALNGRTYDTMNEIVDGIYTPSEKELIRARGIIK